LVAGQEGAFRWVRQTSSSGLSELVRSEELKLFAHHDLVLSDAREMLSNCPFIRFSSAMGVGRIVDETLRSRGIKVNAIVELDSIEAILGMVHLGLGIAIIPEHSTSRRLEGTLSEMSLVPPIRRNVVLVARREQLELPAIGILHETFRAVAAKAEPERAPKQQDHIDRSGDHRKPPTSGR
jgi:DNA-binding transcriptional LysR family regulator